MSKAWTNAKRNLSIGRELKGGAYVVDQHQATAIILKRVATGSLVRVTKSKIETVAARLDDGEAIPFRKIDYTSAIEFGVIVALGNLVAVDTDAREYRKR